MIVNSKMGIKSFFKKVGGWVKDKFHKAKNVVSKFVKPVAKIAKKVVNFVDKTPIGPILSKVSGGIYDTVKKVVNILPDGEVKKNVQNFTDKAQAATGQVIDKAVHIQDKAKDIIDRGRQAAEIVKSSKIM